MAKQLAVTNGQLVATHTTNIVMVDITKDNAMTANNFYHRTKLDSRKKPLSIRRNGKTQVWKTRPNEFRVPCKYGLYEYYNLTQYNAHEWYIAG